MFFKKDYYKPENLTEKEVSIISPSGKYSLTIEHYKTKDGCWNYTRGVVKEGDNLITNVDRNYHHFWYHFVQHSNGYEYLLCGEDYQGYSIINLNTGIRIDYLPKEAKQGFGFCWVDVNTSPDTKYLAVEGCYWACPYEILILDFSDPERFPYKIIDRFDMPYYENCKSFWRNKEFVVTGEQYFRKSDNKNVDEIDEGWEELLLEDGDTWNSELVEIKGVEKVIWEIKENEKDDIIS